MKTIVRMLGILIITFMSNIYAQSIILTSDQQLNELQDPDKKIDLSTGYTKRVLSLRDICESNKARKAHDLTVAFDEFFRQYRTQAGTERKLTPDQDEYISKIKTISDFASNYNLGLRLSLLNPLDIGPGFVNKTGESGKWLHYTVGIRDSETGKFDVQLWRQLFWTNNKGKIKLKLKGARAFAFKEKDINDGEFKAVNPNDIIEIKNNINIDEWSETSIVPKWEPSSLASDVKLPMQRVRIFSDGSPELRGYDRVLVMLEYETPEMDYFSPKALPFLKNMLKKYNDAGVNLTSLYSDEMHIQQDWYYFNHHDNGQFSVKFLTPNFAKEYSKKYGNEYLEMAKYMLYFYQGPNYLSNSPRAILNTQYVFGENPEDVHRTILFRDRYYKMLTNTVVDLVKEAKDYGEELFNRELPTHGHASWAQSPTIDLWNTSNLKMEAYQYDFTPNYIYSNTAQQASAACYDYFKWGEYLQPTGNDFAECGWADRNYYGAAMAASIGVLNKYPNAYGAFWGMPRVCAERKRAVNAAFGAARGSDATKAITDNKHRDIDVLILFPLSLVATQEKYGTWFTQYAYANYITAEKLVEIGKINEDGKIEINGHEYSTLVSFFEITPAVGLLDFMKSFKNENGRILWFGPPPLINGNSKQCLEKWESIFNVNYTPDIYFGQPAPGKQVVFKNSFIGVPQQTILTDFLVDHIYPIELQSNSEKLAEVDGLTVGSKSKNGNAYFFGFRPRDDQSASLGYETRTLFEILNSTGAYPATGKFANDNDNTEYVSRNSDYLATRFPNGTTIIAAHYKDHRENWLDGFSRNDSVDAIALAENPLPSDKIILNKAKINGNEITYDGTLLCAINTDKNGNLVSFEGRDCNQIKIGNRLHKFSDAKLDMLAWTRVTEEEEKKYNSFIKILVSGNGKVTIPIYDDIEDIRLGKIVKEKYSQLNDINYKLNNGLLTFSVTPEISGKWIYLSE